MCDISASLLSGKNLFEILLGHPHLYLNQFFQVFDQYFIGRYFFKRILFEENYSITIAMPVFLRQINVSSISREARLSNQFPNR